MNKQQRRACGALLRMYKEIVLVVLLFSISSSNLYAGRRLFCDFRLLSNFFESRREKKWLTNDAGKDYALEIDLSSSRELSAIDIRQSDHTVVMIDWSTHMMVSHRIGYKKRVRATAGLPFGLKRHHTFISGDWLIGWVEENNPSPYLGRHLEPRKKFAPIAINLINDEVVINLPTKDRAQEFYDGEMDDQQMVAEGGKGFVVVLSHYEADESGDRTIPRYVTAQFDPQKYLNSGSMSPLIKYTSIAALPDIKHPSPLALPTLIDGEVRVEVTETGQAIVSKTVTGRKLYQVSGVNTDFDYFILDGVFVYRSGPMGRYIRGIPLTFEKAKELGLVSR